MARAAEIPVRARIAGRWRDRLKEGEEEEEADMSDKL